MASKDPSMPWYVNDWLSSTAVGAMTLSEQGAFVRLLCHCWASQEAAIPDDDNALAALSMLHKAWAKGSGQVIRKCFEKHPSKPGHLTNKKVFELWQERLVWKQKSAEGGQRSARTRRGNGLPELKGGSRVVQPPYVANVNQTSTIVQPNDQPPPQPNGNSSSSSSSSINSYSLASQNEPPDSTHGGTWFTKPDQHFQAWWAALPDGMRTAERTCWESWEAIIFAIQSRHDLPRDLAIQRLIDRTKLFAKSPKGLQPKYRWSAITFLVDGHYDDDPSAWEVPVDDKKKRSNEPVSIPKLNLK